MKCRYCGSQLDKVFIDLINAPPSNSYLTKDQLNEPEVFYPLKVWVCENCWLVQIEEYKSSDEIFCDEYAYFSSYSKSWVKHAEKYVEMICKRLSLNRYSHVMEIASNDGYLLQFFVKKGIPCFGVEPSLGTAKAAEAKGVESLVDFFGSHLAGKIVNERGKQDLVLGNNVLAHVPDINDFVKGLKTVLSDEGTVTMEFPHILELIRHNQFDTIYHEHFSYLSLNTVEKVFDKNGLKIYDVEELSTHGGSLRIYACHNENKSYSINENVERIKNREQEFGLLNLGVYQSFQKNIDRVKQEFLSYLFEQKRMGKKIVAYGAAAKGNTFLNYCGIKGTNLIDFVVDVSPHKQGKYLPGSHIPIVSEQEICEEKPDIIVVLPWNIADEISEQLSYVKKWSCKFVLAIPELKIYAPK
jgi:cyclopropane fatty-acyl-phospholipid synthase-like methyltransferase